MEKWKGITNMPQRHFSWDVRIGSPNNNFINLPLAIKPPSYKESILTEMHVIPPPESNIPERYLWRLNKCTYGLSDASLAWYSRTRI